ncbi:MAG: hypothetical protein IJD70_10095 [Clostridia bacterium]|nr:hypothetical protein [Clostridia bacterium]
MRRIILCLSALLIFTLPVSADATEMPDGYGDFADSIPDDVAELLPDGFFSDDLSRITESLNTAISPGYIIKVLGELLSGGLGDAFTLFVLLVGVVLLTSLLNTFTDAVSGGNLKGAVVYGSSVCAATAVVSLQLPRIVAAAEFFRRICIVMNSMIPVMTALCLSGGNAAGAAVASASLGLQINLIEISATVLVIPSVSACMALTLADTLRVGEGSLSGIVGSIKHTLTFIFGLCSTLLMASLSAQNILAAAGDNAGARTVKFVAGNMIPVVGSTVGETMRTLATSVRLLRSTVGVAGIIAVAMLLLPFLIGLFLTRLALNSAASVGELLGCKNITKLYREIASLYGYIIAAAAMASLLCVLSLTLFAIGSVAIGGLI